MQVKIEDCAYFSMHGNASGVNARGIEIFTIKR